MTTSDEIIVPLSDIAFDIVGGLGIFSHSPCARIRIDGMPFVEMVRDYERRMLAGDKEVGLAGSYWYLDPNVLIDYLKSEGYGENHQITLLDCICLEDCWPLVCSMEKQENYIIWYDFFQPHRRQWDYSGFGPFGFEKRQLYSALESLKLRDSNTVK